MTSPSYCFHIFLMTDQAGLYISHARHHCYDYIIYDHNSEAPLSDSLIRTKEKCRDILLLDTDRLLEQASRVPWPRIAVSHSLNKDENLMNSPWMICAPEALNNYFLEEVWCRYHHIPMTVLETARCILRELDRSDLAGLFELQKENYSNPSACFFPPEIFPDDAEKYLDQYIDHQYSFYGYGYYAVLHKELPSQPFIGIMGLSDSSLEGEPATEIGYALLEKYQGRRISSEILPALLSVIRLYHSPDPVIAKIRKDNIVSIRLAVNNGLHIIFTDS